MDILDGDRDRDNGIDVDVESSTSEQWVAMRLIDPCKDEDEAIARRALNKIDGPAIIAMPFTGQELLRCVLHRVERSWSRRCLIWPHCG